MKNSCSGFTCLWKTFMSESTNEIDELAGQYLANHILSFAPYVIVYYDYFLTLSDEVDLFWRGEFSLFSTFFLLSRYVSLIGDVPILVFGVIGQPKFMVCTIVNLYQVALQLVQQVLISILSVMQINAIYRSKWVLVLLIPILSTGALIGCWSVYMSAVRRLYCPAMLCAFLPCSRPLTEEEGLSTAISWASTLVLDTSVFILLLLKAIKIGRGVRLLEIIMRNGTMYYTILSLVNLTNILVLRFAPPALRTSSTGLTNALASTIMSRVILNLRAESSKSIRYSPPPLSTWQREPNRTPPLPSSLRPPLLLLLPPPPPNHGPFFSSRSVSERGRYATNIYNLDAAATTATFRDSGDVYRRATDEESSFGVSQRSSMVDGNYDDDEDKFPIIVSLA
ncbi:hypothetical protein B0F90DRAFT_1916569 [Multifurca ochricompacta]|uniref:DUF6533 domain-containing protein n=1 Tax=Multifurca ochricompacta TaxID=376703 RepID=A0AAD4M683_9AGAM|nr:hypothetical protein B0F90DRAFT_1916569 [Multifurca ochricompacta]